jgi:DNA-binding winged helix-turn-helix (wHTH) protein
LQILGALLERPGQILTRDDLKNQIWRDSTFGDFEHGLNAAVNRLRQALGDSADQPHYIETVPGKGYRFIAPVQHPSLMPVLAMASADESVASHLTRARKRRTWPPLIAAAVLTVCVIGGYFSVTHSPAKVAATPIQFVVSPPNGFELQAGSSRQSFAISPDGNRVAFTAMNASGLFTVFLRDMNAIEPRPLPNSEGVNTVFWAPDSRSLFLTVQGSLRRSRLDGDS